MKEPWWRVWLARLWWGDPTEATLGRRGERAAAAYLKKRGFRLVARNVRFRAGEADLLMLDPDGLTLVVVEVKTRRESAGRAHPPAEASVHAHKRVKLLQLRSILARNPRYRGKPIRVDVVAVDWPDRGACVVRHFRDAVRG